VSLVRPGVFRFVSIGSRWDRLVVASLLLGLPLLWFFAIVLGIDRLTTISNRTALSLAIALVAALIIAVSSVRMYFLPSFNDPGAGPYWHLRRERKIIWCILGLLYSLVAALLTAIFSLVITGILAQHVDGETLFVSGVVVSIRANAAPHNPCTSRFNGLSRGARTTWDFCLETAFAPSILKGDIGVGKSFTAELRRTRLGTVVVAVATAERTLNAE
jgi:hypothetical protein